MKKQKKIIGLIGGMGPFASANFYNLLLKKSVDIYGAKNNDDFPEVLLDSVPVPDFISDTGKLNISRKMLVKRVLRMNTYKVNFLAMVCNTGHILHKDLAQVTDAEFYSMIDLVSQVVVKSGYKRVGVLATSTTISYDLYGKALAESGVKVIYSTKEMQKFHEKIIRNMITGKRVAGEINMLEKTTAKLIDENKLDAIILGCTELPLVFPKNKFKNVIDCMDVLADKLLEKYYN